MATSTRCPTRRCWRRWAAWRINKRRYPETPEPERQDKDQPDLQKVDQPQRTDLEDDIPGKQVRYVDVTLPGA